MRVISQKSMFSSNRKYCRCCIAIILSMIFISTFWPTGRSHFADNTIYVDDGNTQGPWDGTLQHPYQHIQDGIDNAHSGNTVYVFNGSYHESVLIPGVYHQYPTQNKTITLIGENRESTLLDGFIWIAADSSNVSGFTIYNSTNSSRGQGIFVGSNHNSITNNNIQNCGDGIWLCDWYRGSTYNMVSDNTITDNWFCGLRVSGRENTVKNNDINNNWNAGIDIGFGSPSNFNYFSNNTVSNNEGGIKLWSSRNNVFHGNIITKNNGRGLYLTGSNNNIISNNSVDYNSEEGIVFETSSYNIVTGNKVVDNKDGININQGSSKNNVSSNNISRNAYGIWNVIWSDNNTIFDNDLTKNICGIYLSNSHDLQIVKNRFSLNKIAATFVICKRVVWDGNYWNKPQSTPKPIFGLKAGIFIQFKTPQIMIDWHPAKSY